MILWLGDDDDDDDDEKKNVNETHVMLAQSRGDSHFGQSLK